MFDVLKLDYNMKIQVLQDVTLCCWVSGFQHFKGAFRHHLQASISPRCSALQFLKTLETTYPLTWYHIPEDGWILSKTSVRTLLLALIVIGLQNACVTLKYQYVVYMQWTKDKLLLLLLLWHFRTLTLAFMASFMRDASSATEINSDWKRGDNFNSRISWVRTWQWNCKEHYWSWQIILIYPTTVFSLKELLQNFHKLMTDNLFYSHCDPLPVSYYKK
jgi:hypothetical protein